MNGSNVYPNRTAPVTVHHAPAPGHCCAPTSGRDFVAKDYVDRLISEVRREIERIQVTGVPVATTSTLGGVIVGNGLSVDATGLLSLDAKALDGKVDKVAGKGLSTNDYTTEEKEKLGDIEKGAQKNPDLSGYATRNELNAVGATAQSASDGASLAIGAVDELRRTVAQKRDRTDNIAAADSFSGFTEWKFSDGKSYSMSVEPNVPVDDPVTGETVEGYAYYFDVYDYYPDSNVVLQVTAYTVDENPLELKFEIYGEALSIWPDGLSATRERIVTTKSGESYVTPTGVKGLLPSPLHALTPEVTDTSITLKPVDGAANYVGGKVEVRPKIIGRSFRVVYEIDNWYLYYAYNEETGEESYDDFSALFACEMSDENSVLDRLYQHPEFSEQVMCEIVTAADIPVKITSDYPDLFDGVKIPKDTRFIFRFDKTDIEMDGDCTDLSSCSFSITPYMLETEDVIVNIPSTVWIDGRDYGLDSWELSDASFTHQVDRRDITAAVALPESTDATKARRFSLALETDADSETEVTWQGGEVIEALPGASKLVPGFTVWDVAEVAPGKFKVDRASSPAQSVPLTLTAPGGRVAELTVGDDLVLEVKEK